MIPRLSSLEMLIVLFIVVAVIMYHFRRLGRISLLPMLVIPVQFWLCKSTTTLKQPVWDNVLVV